MVAHRQPRSSGVFIGIVACMAGVVLTSVVSPITNADDRSLTALGGAPGGATDGVAVDPAAASDGDITGEGAPPEPGQAGRATPAADGAQASSTGSNPGGGEPDGTGATGGPATGPVRGVSGDTIKIGLAVAESGAIEAVAQIGDTEGHLRSVLAGWEKAGLVPVHGRKIEPVVRTFSLLSEAEQRAACVGFAQDDGVFMVLAPLVFVVGAECLAREFKIPVIASAGTVPGEDWFARTHPYGFYTNMSDTRVGVNFIHWAHDKGLLEGKRIGLNYDDDPVSTQRVQRSIKGTLAQLGYEVALDFPSPEESGDLAVQRFIASRIDLAIVMGMNQTAPRAADFSRAAQVQGYKPKYIVSEFLGTSTLAPGFADTFQPDQFDGVLAMTYYQRAEDGRFGNPPIPQAGIQCERQYESFSGRQIDRFENSNEWDALQHSCDQGRATMTALQSAGRNLTAIGFVRGLETVRGQESGEMAPIGFSPAKHDGANGIKAMRWARSCSCWLNAGAFRSLYVNG